MKLDNFDLVASLQALPETDPVEIDGIQFGKKGGGGNVRTCQQACIGIATIVNTVCVGVTCQ